MLISPELLPPRDVGQRERSAMWPSKSSLNTLCFLRGHENLSDLHPTDPTALFSAPLRQYAPKCSVCMEPIMPEPGRDETVRVVALDKNFHMKCYKCEVSCPSCPLREVTLSLGIQHRKGLPNGREVFYCGRGGESGEVLGERRGQNGMQTGEVPSLHWGGGGEGTLEAERDLVGNEWGHDVVRKTHDQDTSSEPCEAFGFPN